MCAGHTCCWTIRVSTTSVIFVFFLLPEAFFMRNQLKEIHSIKCRLWNRFIDSLIRTVHNRISFARIQGAFELMKHYKLKLLSENKTFIKQMNLDSNKPFAESIENHLTKPFNEFCWTSNKAVTENIQFGNNSETIFTKQTVRRARAIFRNNTAASNILVSGIGTFNGLHSSPNIHSWISLVR